MPGISILTAVHEPNPEYMLESLAAIQEGQPGVELEWVVYYDGSEKDYKSNIPFEVEVAPQTVLWHGNTAIHLGVAATRNLALLECYHPLVMNLDADDILQPGALAALAGALEEYPKAAFAFGRTLNLCPDGSLREWNGTLVQAENGGTEQPRMTYEPGLVPAGVVEAMWWKTGRHDVTLAATMWRKLNLLAQLYPALQTREDQLLLFRINKDYPGVFVPEPTILHYSEHPGQSTRQPEALRNDPLNQRLVAASLLANQALTGNFPRYEDCYVPDEIRGAPGEGISRWWLLGPEGYEEAHRQEDERKGN